jgi:zinc transport system substrate-binding protein
VLLAIVGGPLVACGADAGAGGAGDGSALVVAGFYPLAEAAQRVGGPDDEVVNLTPPGVEPHDLEVSPDQVADLEDADLVLYLGGGFQPAVEEVADRRDGPSLDLLDALHAAFEAGLADCDRTDIVTAHDAFSYLADRYGLRQIAIAGVSSESEPDPDRLAELTDLAESLGVTTIFYESLVPPELAETLAREAGVDTAVLDPIEGLGEEEIADGASYVSVMRDNLAALQTALDCG